jgi:hypothetical protein
MDSKFGQRYLQAHCQSHTSQHTDQSLVKELAKPIHLAKGIFCQRTKQNKFVLRGYVSGN